MKMKKMGNLLAVGLAAVLLLGGCGNETETTAGENTAENNSSSDNATEKEADTRDTDETVTVSIALSPNSFQGIIAEKEGLAEKAFEGENVQFVYSAFANGPATLEALESGDVDLVLGVGELPVITSKGAGRDVEIILGIDGTNTFYYAVHGDSDINEFADLKGKSIGVSYGTVSHQLILSNIEDAGLSEADFEIANLTDADSFTAFEAGEIDAAMVGTPNIQKYIDAGARILDESYSSLEVTLVRGEFGKEHPDIVSKYLQVYQDAGLYLSENPDEAIAYINEYNGRGSDAVKELFVNGVYKDILHELNDEQLDHLSDVIQFAERQGLITYPYTIDDLYNPSYLRNLLGQ